MTFLQEHSQWYLILNWFTIQDLGSGENSNLITIKYIKTSCNCWDVYEQDCVIRLIIIAGTVLQRASQLCDLCYYLHWLFVARICLKSHPLNFDEHGVWHMCHFYSISIQVINRHNSSKKCMYKTETLFCLHGSREYCTLVYLLPL